MAMVETRYRHIVLRDDGVPMIEGTRLKVVHIVLAQQANGYSPEDLVTQYPPIKLGQVHSALAYYADHKEELDRYIEEQDRAAEEHRAEYDAVDLKKKLLERAREMGLR